MPAPQVTGISPKEGPPGTRVTIRGENLGSNPNDLIGVWICGADCLLSSEWKSPNKIITRSGTGEGRGEVIVATMSGGRGTCTVTFYAYHDVVGALHESAVWVEESSGLHHRRRSLHPVQGLMDEDPLGLSDEVNDKRIPEEELLSHFPESSGRLTADNFSPVWWLLENHLQTPFDDLKAGLQYLKRSVGGQKKGHISFLKANIGPVLDQLDTLMTFKSQYENDVGERGKDIVETAETALVGAKESADDLFREILSRREQADSTRSALAALQRFKFIFNLPRSIQANIDREDYAMVVNDYNRAKTFCGEAKAEHFKMVLEVVEKLVKDLRNTITEKIRSYEIPVEDTKKMLRFLVELDYPGDPGWDWIVDRGEHYVKELLQCHEYFADHSTDTAPDSDRKSEERSGAVVPPRVVFVESATDILTACFSTVWPVGSAYMKTDLHPRLIPKHHWKEFEEILEKIIVTYCQTVESNLTRTMGERSILDWLPHCLGEVKEAFNVVSDLPTNLRGMLRTLLSKLRIFCLQEVLVGSCEVVSGMVKCEKWCVELDDRRGMNTQLPMFFEALMMELLDALTESVIDIGEGEIEIIHREDTQEALQQGLTRVILAFIKVFRTLSLEAGQFGDNRRGHSQHRSHHHAGRYHVEHERTDVESLLMERPRLLQHGKPKLESDPESAANLLVLSRARLIGSEMVLANLTGTLREKRLLIILNNVTVLQEEILPRLQEVFMAKEFPHKPFSDGLTSCRGLKRDLQDLFVESVSGPLVGLMEPAMYRGHFNWARCPAPTAPSPYVKEAILKMVDIHSLVLAVSPASNRQLLIPIVESLCEEVTRLLACVTEFSRNGTLQAVLDLRSLESAFPNLLTDVCKGQLDEAIESLPSLEQEESDVVGEILIDFQREMKLFLMHFR